MTRSSEDVARFIVSTAVEENILVYNFDDRTDAGKQIWLRVAEKTMKFIEANEVEAKLQDLESLHEESHIVLATTRYIREELAPTDINTVEDARDFFYNRYMRADCGSLIELEAWSAYSLFNRG